MAVAIVASGGWFSFRPRPTSSGERAQRTIAVLPFVAGDAADGSVDDYIAFGMTEALITELSRVGALKVISQTSRWQRVCASPESDRQRTGRRHHRRGSGAA
jgi:TolB-like protein